jgi:hypothetical protein
LRTPTEWNCNKVHHKLQWTLDQRYQLASGHDRKKVAPVPVQDDITGHIQVRLLDHASSTPQCLNRAACVSQCLKGSNDYRVSHRPKASDPAP